VQQLPASADAFVWLRLYHVSLDASAPSGADDPLWWTNRKPLRPLTYHIDVAHREHAVVETGGVRIAKTMGLRNLPYID
jgi:hypothetical protein